MSLTFTGLDEKTDLNAAEQFAHDNQCELGILWSCSQKDNPRYPSFEFITQVLSKMASRVAVHVCGSEARSSALSHSETIEVLRRARRLQVNGPLLPDQLMRYLAVYDRQTIITQHTDHNLPLMMVWGDGRHSLLVDNSGGRGIIPEEWRRPRTSKPVGFAGGLGPETLAEQYPKIHAHAGLGWWLDMESSLRDENGLFSLQRAAQALEAFKAALELPPTA